MAFPLVAIKKPVKGEAWLKAKSVRADRVAAEQKAMKLAKKLDGGCRYPLCEYKTKKPRIDAAHQHHRGMGGNPSGDRTTSDQIISLCFIDHAAYDRGDIDFEPLTDKGTRGPCAWYRVNKETGSMEHIATEKSVSYLETRT